MSWLTLTASILTVLASGPTIIEKPTGTVVDVGDTGSLVSPFFNNAD